MITTLDLKGRPITKDGKFIFLSEIGTTQFDEHNGKWIQLLSVTTVNHPDHGIIDITPERITRFADNINARVRGVDLDVDYVHKRGVEGDKAAGWIKAGEARSNGLWGYVTFTPAGRKSVEDGEYRYMSSEFRDEWTDTKVPPVSHQDVLFGAALTNRPFLRDMAPINFAELQDDETTDVDEGPFDRPDGQYDPDDANLKDATSSTSRCLNCAFFTEGTSNDDSDKDGDGGSCLIVSGVIDPDQVCDFFHAMSTYGNGYFGMSEEEVRAWDDYTYEMTEEDEQWLATEFRDIPQSARKKMPASSFAGKGTSFPIQKCEDVKAAWIRVNTAGPSNYGKSTLYANIKRIAKAKGFTSCLPKTAQAKMAEIEGKEVSTNLETKELAEVLGLKEDATDEQIKDRATKLVAFFKKNTPDATTRRFEEDYPEQAKQMAADRRERDELKIDSQIEKWARRGLAPRHHDKVKAFMLGDDTYKFEEAGEEKEASVTFADIIDGILQTGLVKFDVHDDGSDKTDLDDAATTFETSVKKLHEEKSADNKKYSFRDAVNEMSKKDPAGAKAYAKRRPTVSAGTEGGR